MKTTIDQVIVQLVEENLTFNGWPVGNMLLCIAALVLTVILTGAVGIERERRGRSAGLRTHLLVGMGSCLIMIISIYGFPANSGNRDVARLAAQVIAGVGFLGAGAIIHRNAGIKGLTTAATIWIAMAIGLACGSMNFILAISGTLLIILVLTVFRKLETHMNRKAPLIMVRALPETPVASRLLEIAQAFNCTIQDLQVELNDAGDIEATFLAESNSNEFSVPEFVSKIEAVEGVRSVGIINGHKP